MDRALFKAHISVTWAVLRSRLTVSSERDGDVVALKRLALGGRWYRDVYMCVSIYIYICF